MLILLVGAYPIIAKHTNNIGFFPNNSFVRYYILSTIISVVVVYLAMFLSRVVSNNKILNFLLRGVKHKDKTEENIEMGKQHVS